MTEPMVVVFTGLPGTGKSTLADLVAQQIRAPAFAGDWLLGALAPHGVLSGLDRQSYLTVDAINPITHNLQLVLRHLGLDR